MTDLVEIVAQAMQDEQYSYSSPRMPHVSSMAQAALAAIKDAGFAVVPVEPTEAMVEAGKNDGEWDKGYVGREVSDLATSVYTAMIQAAG